MKLQAGHISAIDKFNTDFNFIFKHSIFQYFDDYNYARSLIIKISFPSGPKTVALTTLS